MFVCVIKIYSHTTHSARKTNLTFYGWSPEGKRKIAHEPNRRTKKTFKLNLSKFVTNLHFPVHGV